MKLVLNVVMFGALMGILAPSGFGGSIFVEGSSGRLVDGNGNDVIDTPGALGLCDAFTPGTTTCTGTNDNSDIFLWIAVNNGLGQQIATNFAFCSDVITADAGDPFIAGCSDLTVNQFLGQNHLEILEAALIGGVENTPYTPQAGQPGFNALFNISYELISDTPEPGSFMLFGGGLLGLAAAATRRLRTNGK